MPERCTSASWTPQARCWCTATSRRRVTTSCRPWPLIAATAWWWPPRAWSAWYWLADLCAEYEVPFVLGHALYMKAIHGGKTKTDKIDSQKIAMLLRGGMLPMAYVYPAAMRATRDLLRRRTRLVRTRAEALAHVQNTISQYNLPPIGKKLTFAANREGVAERFENP